MNWKSLTREERVRIVSEGLKEGLSFSELADTFGTTKGAVGAIVRDYIRPGVGHRKLRNKPLSMAPVDYYSQVDMSKTGFGHVMLYNDHKPGRDCTWPLWRDNFIPGLSHVCGLPVEKGRFYCSGHVLMSKGEGDGTTEKDGSEPVDR